MEENKDLFAEDEREKITEEALSLESTDQSLPSEEIPGIDPVEAFLPEPEDLSGGSAREPDMEPDTEDSAWEPDMEPDTEDYVREPEPRMNSALHSEYVSSSGELSEGEERITEEITLEEAGAAEQRREPEEAQKAGAKAAEEAQKAGEKAAEEAKKAGEKAAEEAKKAEEKAAEEAQKAEAKAAEEAKKAEAKAAEEARKAEEKAKRDEEKARKKEARKAARAARREAVKNWVPGPQFPNYLTIARICMIPLFVALILWVPKPAGNILAMIVFILASLTDTADGYIARKYNYITTFGKFMDPLADKLLVCSALICLVDLGRIESWIVIIIIAREFIISGFRLVAVEKGVVIAANIWGKVKTVLQMLMVILMLANFGGILGIAAQILKWAALALTLISLITYLFQNRHVLQEEVRNS